MKPAILMKYWLFVSAVSASTLNGKLTLSETKVTGAVQLACTNSPPDIYIDPDDSVSVVRAAHDLALDFGRVFGKNATVRFTNETHPTSMAIIAGTIDKSTFLQRLIADHKLDVTSIRGQWESYSSALVLGPAKGIQNALVIAGSDRRGAIYGLYDISEQIGVSPLFWWTDVTPTKLDAIYALDVQKVQGPPSVKYRGIFINDEAPALHNWILANYGEVENGDPAFISRFYAHVFELILRLKGNYLWPAMWSNMFYVDDTNNGPLADYYGVVMGTSHTEPMARATNEQSQFLNGTWDWISNEVNVKAFMREGVIRSQHWETAYTMGMRGLGDAASPTLNATVEESIVSWQESVLSDILNKTNLSNVVQPFVLFDELGTYYESGMTVPDQVTLIYPDDNAGNMLRLPLQNETGRSGGAGIYYHFDMNAPPRCYKWINTAQLIRTWDQLRAAYSHGAQTEIPMSFFFDMAYDINGFSDPGSTYKWLEWWATKQFGANVASQTASIMTEYGQLIIRAKYEELSKTPYFFSVTDYGEAQSNLQLWEDLEDHARAAYSQVRPERQDAFFELILHPVLAGGNVERLYERLAENTLSAKQLRASTNDRANEVLAAFQTDKDIETRWNNLQGGKWNHLMDQPHIGYTDWSDPPSNILPNVTFITGSTVDKSPCGVGVAVEGGAWTITNSSKVAAMPVNPYLPPSERRYLDLYATRNGSFGYSVSSNVSYVKVSASTGRLSSPGTSDVRTNITVDWHNAPPGLTYAALSVKCVDKEVQTLEVLLPVNHTAVPSGFKGFVESNGAVSIEAEHFTSATQSSSASYEVLPGYGRTLSGVTLTPNTCPSQTIHDGPVLTYDLYTFTSSPNATVNLYLGPSLNINRLRPLLLAVSVDDSNPVMLQPVADYVLGPPEGGENAIEGIWMRSVAVGPISPGRHTLRYWALEPGLIVEKLVLNLGGVRQSFLGPPESLRL
ncbi:hypothetical protein HFD88_005921 [Aspergillus terreus]|nr:hypothetical protein HFD88_005921 [Aspergillus terreus]